MGIITWNPFKIFILGYFTINYNFKKIQNQRQLIPLQHYFNTQIIYFHLSEAFYVCFCHSCQYLPIKIIPQYQPMGVGSMRALDTKIYGGSRPLHKMEQYNEYSWPPPYPQVFHPQILSILCMYVFYFLFISMIQSLNFLFMYCK